MDTFIYIYTYIFSYLVSGENKADKNPRGFCEVPVDKNGIVCHNIEGGMV